MNGLIERVQNLWLAMERLSGREKIMVLGIVGGVLAVLVFFFLFFVNRNLNLADSRLKTQTDNLATILEMRSQFKNASVDVDKEQQQIKNKPHQRDQCGGQRGRGIGRGNQKPDRVQRHAGSATGNRHPYRQRVLVPYRGSGAAGFHGKVGKQIHASVRPRVQGSPPLRQHGSGGCDRPDFHGEGSGHLMVGRMQWLPFWKN